MMNLLQLANNHQMINLLRGLTENNEAMHKDMKEMEKLVHENWTLGPLEVRIIKLLYLQTNISYCKDVISRTAKFFMFDPSITDYKSLEQHVRASSGFSPNFTFLSSDSCLFIFADKTRGRGPI